ncbi:MAG: glycosyltransferase [Gemmatimonadetes bacterium]|nr:glycosyltransferase [Gemmatimonadota bacterium]
MKVVDVAELYAEAGGGVRTYIDQKVGSVATSGHEVVVVAPGPRDGEELRPGGRIVWVRSPRLPLDRRYHVFARRAPIRAVLEREQPDVLECSSPWSAGAVCARWSGSPVRSLVLHQDPVAVYPETLLPGVDEDRIHRWCGWYWRRMRRLSARFDVTVVGSTWHSDRLRRFGVQNTRVVPLGIARARFASTERDSALRRELLARCGLGENARLLVAVSRHHPEKRVGTMIDAVRVARRERALGLVLFGDGPLRAWVDRRASRGSGVHVAGFVRDRERLARALASADAFLHGSAAETFGLAVAEAVAVGLPVVTPDAGAAADLVEPSYANTYRAGDVEGCAAAIVQLLDRLSKIDRAAVRRVAERRIHTAGDHFRSLMSCYGELLVRSGRGRTGSRQALPA